MSEIMNVFLPMRAGSERIPKKNTNSSIAIKGRCIGFDSLLQQIKLDQCLILEP